MEYSEEMTDKQKAKAIVDEHLAPVKAHQKEQMFFILCLMGVSFAIYHSTGRITNTMVPLFGLGCLYCLVTTLAGARFCLRYRRALKVALDMTSHPYLKAIRDELQGLANLKPEDLSDLPPADSKERPTTVNDMLVADGKEPIKPKRCECKDKLTGFQCTKHENHTGPHTAARFEWITKCDDERGCIFRDAHNFLGNEWKECWRCGYKKNFKPAEPVVVDEEDVNSN